jgi:hypothetical protein
MRNFKLLLHLKGNSSFIIYNKKICNHELLF